MSVCGGVGRERARAGRALTCPRRYACNERPAFSSRPPTTPRIHAVFTFKDTSALTWGGGSTEEGTAVAVAMMLRVCVLLLGWAPQRWTRRLAPYQVLWRVACGVWGWWWHMVSLLPSSVRGGWGMTSRMHAIRCGRVACRCSVGREGQNETRVRAACYDKS